MEIKEIPPRVRHELKYIVPADRAEEIRNYIQIFCKHDPFANGDPPVYDVTTLQLDSPGLALHYAKDRKQVNRFKLRVRTYGSSLNSTVFFEVKRREEQFIRKTRSRVQPLDYSDKLFTEPYTIPEFKNDEEYANHLEFLRLKKVIDARPAVNIRYERESWISDTDSEIRITMDRKIRYRLADGYKLFNGDEKDWRVMDSETALRRPYGGMVLEIKIPLHVPTWVLHLIRMFDLERTGFCKYSTAMRLESLFTGQSYTAASERCNL
ncbi:MAG: polyphosphate polymerase domain-containing protein [Verrucomicrobia bacterium]|nr:polyphosphate polymerase domain-containing protein [Verrucomicrobiota bacterium]